MVAFANGTSLEAIFIKFRNIFGLEMGIVSSINGVYVTRGLDLDIEVIIIQVLGTGFVTHLWSLQLRKVSANLIMTQQFPISRVYLEDGFKVEKLFCAGNVFLVRCFAYG